MPLETNADISTRPRGSSTSRPGSNSYPIAGRADEPQRRLHQRHTVARALRRPLQHQHRHRGERDPSPPYARRRLRPPRRRRDASRPAHESAAGPPTPAGRAQTLRRCRSRSRRSIKPKPKLTISISDGGLKLSGKDVSIRVHALQRCACHGSLKLVYTHEVTLKNHKRKRESTVIGHANYSVPAGGSRTVKDQADRRRSQARCGTRRNTACRWS